jgi:hypothetical protein
MNLDSDEFWAAAWALAHAVGLFAMLTLRHRSLRQVHVAEHWRAHAAPGEREEADDLVMLTRDRHRRNNALTIVIGGYFLLGVLVVSVAIEPWLDPALYRAASRLILIGGEAVLIGSAWISVRVGDQLARSAAGEIGRPSDDVGAIRP